MMDRADYTCGNCFKTGMNEQQAVVHECGEPDPVPDMTEAPMTTREAVTVLANQMANITEQLARINELLIGVGAMVERKITPTVIKESE